MANILTPEEDNLFDELCKQMTAEADIQFSANTTFYNKAQLIKALQYSKALNDDIDVEVMDYYITLLDQSFIEITTKEGA